jgi:hypothetical protein
MNTEQPQESFGSGDASPLSFGSGASEAPAARSAELRSLPTPGPWYARDEVCVGPTVVHSQGCFEIVDDEDRNRAHVLCTRFPWPDRADEMRANARLIAAAPDLLDALEDALEFIEDCSDVSDGPDGEQVPNRAMQLAGPIRAVIAKARGEA